MSLMYVACRTRPDILKEVVYLSTKCKSPSKDHKLKAMRILAYLNLTKVNKFVFIAKSTDLDEIYDYKFKLTF